MKLYFPSRYNDLDRLEQIDKLRKKTIHILNSIIANDFDLHTEEIKKINKYFLSNYKVKSFNSNDPKCVLIEMDNAFEDVCFVLESNGIQRPKELSIYEFQRKIELIKKKTKPQKPTRNDDQGIAVR